MATCWILSVFRSKSTSVYCFASCCIHLLLCVGEAGVKLSILVFAGCRGAWPGCSRRRCSGSSCGCRDLTPSSERPWSRARLPQSASILNDLPGKRGQLLTNLEPDPGGFRTPDLQRPTGDTCLAAVRGDLMKGGK